MVWGDFRVEPEEKRKLGPASTWKFPVVLLAEFFFVVFALAGFSGGQRVLG